MSQHVEHLIVSPQKRRGVGVGVKMAALFILIDALLALLQMRDPMMIVVMAVMIMVILD